MLRDQLMADGVSADAIEVIPEEQVAVDHALNMAQKDDQLLIFVDAIGRSWRQIQEFQSDSEEGDSEDQHPPHAVDLGAFGGFQDLGLDQDIELIRDERGVRIAASEESD